MYQIFDPLVSDSRKLFWFSDSDRYSSNPITTERNQNVLGVLNAIVFVSQLSHYTNL